MSEALTLALAWSAGAALSVIFFGGLWWTVRRAVSSRQPALWFSASLLLRTSVTLTGFYLVSGRDWQRVLPCLLGFVMTRSVVTSRARPAADRKPRGASHAP